MAGTVLDKPKNGYSPGPKGTLQSNEGRTDSNNIHNHIITTAMKTVIGKFKVL